MPQQTKPHAQDIICIENQIVWNPEKNNANLLLFNHREKTCTNNYLHLSFHLINNALSQNFYQQIICQSLGNCNFSQLMYFCHFLLSSLFAIFCQQICNFKWCIFVCFFHLHLSKTWKLQFLLHPSKSFGSGPLVLSQFFSQAITLHPQFHS